MTAPLIPDAERAAFEEPAASQASFELWRSLQPYGGATEKQETAFRDGFEAARRELLARQVPAFASIAERKLNDLLARGYKITGYAIEQPGDVPQRGFITHGGLVGWWWPEGARQVAEWMPISTAPKDGSPILLAMPDDGEGAGIVAQGHWQKGWADAPDEMGCDDGFVDCVYQEFSPARTFGAEECRHAGVQPTNWMPLPPPPLPDNSAFSKPDQAPKYQIEAWQVIRHGNDGMRRRVMIGTKEEAGATAKACLPLKADIEPLWLRLDEQDVSGHLASAASKPD